MALWCVVLACGRACACVVRSHVTSLSCLMTCSTLPCAVQSLTALSLHDVATNCRFGWNATQVTSPMCPLSCSWTGWSHPLGALHSMATLHDLQCSVEDLLCPRQIAVKYCSHSLQRICRGIAPRAAKWRIRGQGYLSLEQLARTVPFQPKMRDLTSPFEEQRFAIRCLHHRQFNRASARVSDEAHG